MVTKINEFYIVLYRRCYACQWRIQDSGKKRVDSSYTYRYSETERICLTNTATNLTHILRNFIVSPGSQNGADDLWSARL